MVRIKKLIAGAAVAAVAGGGILLGAAPAFATTDAPWEPDAQATGTLAFYNAAGQQVTSGTSLSNAFTYAVASGNGAADQAGATSASIGYAFPNSSSTPATYFVAAAGGSTDFLPTPPAGTPSTITSLNHPFNVSNAANGGSNLAVVDGAGTNDPTAHYDHVLQVRLFTSGGGSAVSPTEYFAADIHVNLATGSWNEVFPIDVAATTTTLTAVPASAPAGSSVVLTATETPAVAGSVQFEDITVPATPVNIGSPVAVNGSGVATTSSTTLSVGTHHLAAVFTPTDSLNSGVSQGKADATVTGPATNTSLVVDHTGAGAAGVDTHLTATVTEAIGGAGVTAGTVDFYDNGLAGTHLGTVTPGTAGGVYVLDLPTGLAAGGHSVTAVFTPTNPATDAASTSSPQVFSDTAAATGACAQTGSSCTDKQFIEAGIPVGTLTITTPYNGTGTGCAAPTGTAAGAPAIGTGITPDPNDPTSNPGCVDGVLNIGTLHLTSDAHEFTANTTFSDIVVTDGRSGALPWTVQASSSDLTDGSGNANGVIDSQNVGLTNIVSFPGTGFLGIVTGVNNPAAEPAVGPGAAIGVIGDQGLGGPTVGVGGLAHNIASVDHGTGSVTMNGTITLNAPTSTEAGVFTGTITFTVS